MAFHIEQRELQGISLFEVSGKIDKSSAVELRRVLLERVKGGSSSVLLDCAQLEAIDSAGLRMLVQIKERLKARGAIYALCSLPAEVQNVLDRTPHLTLRLAIFQTRAEAFRWLQKSLRVARVAKLAGTLLRRSADGHGAKVLARSNVQPRRLKLAASLLGLGDPDSDT